MDDQQKSFITKEGLKKIKEELDYLKNIKRKEVIEKVGLAKEYGDLSENAEYIEAKNEQGFVEGRIAELEEIVKTAYIPSFSKKTNQIVRIGSRVKVEENGNNSVYEIVGSKEADPSRGKISHESPLGQAFLGRKVGEQVEAVVPRGKIQYKIIEVN